MVFQHTLYIHALWISLYEFHTANSGFPEARFELKTVSKHDDIMKWKRFPYYWAFEGRFYRGPVDSAHKGHYNSQLPVIWEVMKLM